MTLIATRFYLIKLLIIFSSQKAQSYIYIKFNKNYLKIYCTNITGELIIHVDYFNVLYSRQNLFYLNNYIVLTYLPKDLPFTPVFLTRLPILDNTIIDDKT